MELFILMMIFPLYSSAVSRHIPAVSICDSGYSVSCGLKSNIIVCYMLHANSGSSTLHPLQETLWKWKMEK